MASIKHIGIDDVSERALLLAGVDSVSDIPASIDVGSKCFVALVAWDARSVNTREVARVARMLLDAGCVYFCCWGPGCERVHDIIDEEYVGDGTRVLDDAATIMTTWHDNVSLAEAAWFALNVAFPDDRFFDECKALLSICIGNSSWTGELEQSLADPRALAWRVVGEEGERPNKSLERTREG